MSTGLASEPRVVLRSSRSSLVLRIGPSLTCVVGLLVPPLAGWGDWPVAAVVVLPVVPCLIVALQVANHVRGQVVAAPDVLVVRRPLSPAVRIPWSEVQGVRIAGWRTVVDVAGRRRPLWTFLDHGFLGFGDRAAQRQDCWTLEQWWVEHRGADWRPADDA